MPVTRARRSKAVSATVHLNTEPGTLDDLHSAFSDTDHHSEDEDSDWELTALHRRKGSRGRPRKKRARLDTGRNVHPASSNGGLTPGKLDVFPSLPLDIIYEVLSLLSPVDLANLAQTNRAFRTTLTSDPQSSRVWNIARKLHGNGPECPQDVPLVPWVRFVHGPPKCGVCGAINVHFVDFHIRRRLCKKCRKQKLVYSRFFSKRFPEFEPSILELIPHTWIGGAKMGRGREKSKFYWDDDIYAMAAVYVKFQSDIYLRKPGAKDALQKFKSERIEYVKAVDEHAKRCAEQWSDLLQFQSRQAREHAQSQYTEIVGRFRQLGYEAADICAIQHAPEVNRARAAITEGVWTHIRAPLQRIIESARCKRLEREAAAIINARKRLVKIAYNTYKRTLRPIEWVHLPPPQLIYVMPTFRDLIYTKLDEPLDQTTCDEAAERLPEYISAFMGALKQHLLQDLADSDALRSRGKRAKRVPKNETDDRLFLATTVFRGQDPTANLHSFGDITAYLSSLEMRGTWDSEAYISLLEKRRWGFWDRLCTYDGAESLVAHALVTALGLDPATARPEDLDEMDPRFTCGNCTRLDVRAYSWRRFVPHHCTAHRWRQPQIRVLSEEESAAVRRAQGADPAAQQSMWSCNHCTAHLDNSQTRAVVATHVQETHAIAEPQEGVDYFHAFPHMRAHPDPLPYPGGLVV